MARLNPTDVVAYGAPGDALCTPCAERTSYAAPVTRADLANHSIGLLYCEGCGKVIVDGVAQTRSATTDVEDAFSIVFPDSAPGVIGTGGGCEAVCATLPDGYLLATNGDAARPDGWDLAVYRYVGDDDDDPQQVWDAGHDVAGLTAALRAVKGA